MRRNTLLLCALLALPTLALAGPAAAQDYGDYVGSVGNAAVFADGLGNYYVQCAAAEHVELYVDNRTRTADLYTRDDYTSLSYVETIHVYGSDDADELYAYVDDPQEDDDHRFHDVAVFLLGEGGDDDLRLDGAGAVWGGDGDDYLYASRAPRAELYGEGGNDTIVVGGQCPDAYVDAGGGDDWVSLYYFSGGNCLVHLGAGDDNVLLGTGAGDATLTVYGDEGYDHCWHYFQPGTDVYCEQVSGSVQFPP